MVFYDQETKLDLPITLNDMHELEKIEKNGYETKQQEYLI